MKIAVWHNLPSGGGKRALYDQIRGLLARGHSVVAWCPPSADQTYLPLSDLIVEHVVPLALPIPFSRLDECQIRLEAERAVAAMDAHCSLCADQIDAGSFDIVLANSCQFFAVSAIGRLTRTPAVLYLQEPYRRLYEALPQLAWVARPPSTLSVFSARRWRSAFADLRLNRNMRLRAREEQRNAAAFDRILVNSYFSRESLLRAYGLDSTVCYLGIDTDRFEDRQETRDNFVVGLGSLTSVKNVELAIEALALVPEPRPSLVWIGNTTDDDFVASMRCLAAEKNVHFEPRVRVSDAELIDLLNKGLAILYAPRLEPFGLAPLEAAACGMPAIAVFEGGVRETVRDEVTGLLVPNNAEAMAAAIVRLRDDPALARRLGTNARCDVDKRWNHAAATLRIETELWRQVRARTA